MRKPSRRRLWVGVFLMTGWAVVSGGCTPPPPLNPEGIQIDPAGPEDVDVPAPITDSRKVTFRVLRVELPLDRVIEPLWGLVDESVLPEVSRAVWNGNGLRLGVLRPEQRSDFFDVLAPVFGQANSAYTAYDRATPLRRSPPLKATFIADLTRPGSPVELVDMDGGRLQLLASVQPAAAGFTRFALTPHHYRHRFSLTPRDVLEKELDGRVFDELGVDVSLSPEDVLVLGLYRYTPPPLTAEPLEATETDQATPPDGPTSGRPAVDLPLDFGRGLFTSGRSPDDTQYLLLLRVEASDG